jgi:ubiquitin-conjugating enzyme E2 G1
VFHRANLHRSSRSCNHFVFCSSVSPLHIAAWNNGLDEVVGRPNVFISGKEVDCESFVSFLSAELLVQRTNDAPKPEEECSVNHFNPPTCSFPLFQSQSMAASKQRAEVFLMQELKALSTSTRDRDDAFSAGLNGNDLFNWSVCIIGPEGSLNEGGIFQASLQFPPSYPDNPSVMRFITPIFHPNIWADGKVCISVLRDPGEDPLNPQEQAWERWLPIHKVYSICMSVSISLPVPFFDLNHRF